MNKIMKKEFQNNTVIQAPDIVLYLDKTNEQYERNGILLLLRGDVEKKITKKETEKIEEIVRRYTNKMEYGDTAKWNSILAKDRETKLEELLEKYRKAKLVITDRFHGMIFAAITSTPCVVLGNYNHKVKEGSEVLKHLKYIKYIEDINNLEQNIH